MKHFHNWFIGDCLAKTNNFYERVKELLQNTSGENTLSQKNNILSTFYDWKGKQEQIGDVCIFGVKI
ncbi:MAG: hypothetical protein FD123_1644 [Bacteroidetes bacterium]|nr:MAG: hypothetical protein FD123_1644 [Bacteroidota bacterium]